MKNRAETISPTKLVETVRAMLRKFHNRLSGPKQPTRSQLVEYLASGLGVPLESAEHLFDELRKAGMILRADDKLGADSQFPESQEQQWEIQAADAPDATVAAIVEAHAKRFPSVAGAEPPALGLLRRAVASRATDVHFDPFHDEVEVRFRIDGRLEHYCRLAEDVAKHLLSQFKVMANLDLNEHFAPQDGRLELPVEFAETDVRITTARVADGEAATLRILPRDRLIRPLDQLGLSNSAIASLDLLQAESDGLVLLAGPTGAGKTTTAYSMINHLDDGHRSIVTIEDPIEYRVCSFTQMDVDPRHGITFAEGVKTALRMDPDIILLGEIRDAETAAAAMRASSCGKHVFSTFHARDAAAATAALRDFGVSPKSLASSLRGIISQRLVRRLCPECRSERPVDEEAENVFKAFDVDPPAQLPHAIGCPDCRQTGYRERIGVFEVALNTPEFAEAIEEGWSELQLRQLLRDQGTPSLIADALRKVRDGKTTLEEVRTMAWTNLLAGTAPTLAS